MDSKIKKILIGALFVLLLVLAAVAWHLLNALPTAGMSAPFPSEPRYWTESGRAGLEDLDSGVFAYLGSRGPAPASERELAYRLAGTFLEYGSPDGPKPARKAIIDDLERGEQALLSEGDSYRDIVVDRISTDHILVEREGMIHELWLSFSSADQAEDGAPGRSAPSDPAAEEFGDSNRFGRQVDEMRWVFQKDALRDFYNELLDDPARAVDIYETMRPDYDAQERIQGYVVDIVGEQDFFAAVGLRNGDIVRKVNSMEMRSRNRAEYFIKEFMQDRVNAVVLDIERDGEARKQVYLLR
jgi:type II secretory pathway component PulC